MNNRRAKIIAGATVVGLGALGGVAMQSNQGIPAAQLASSQSGAIVTSASGTATTAQPIATTAQTRPPIVTRASGGGAPVSVDD